MTAPQELTGPLALNTYLNNVEQLFFDDLAGPEHVLSKDGDIYTAIGTGEIFKLSASQHKTFVTKFGKPCGSYLNIILEV